MKTRVFTMILIGYTLTASNIALASTLACSFIASGRASLLEDASKSESNMIKNAQAQCETGLIAKQLSATQFVLYPHSYPIEEYASAWFSCTGSYEQQAISEDRLAKVSFQ